jgi:hypothetical protein
MSQTKSGFWGLGKSSALRIGFLIGIRKDGKRPDPLISLREPLSGSVQQPVTPDPDPGSMSEG